MKKNLYIEYRKWVFFWGLFLDGQEEVQKVLDEYNLQGWNCIQFEWDTSRKYTIFRVISIFLVTIISLGFITFWSGFSIVFEKEENKAEFSNSDTKSFNLSYQEWKKSNPDKSLNDFYSQMK